MEQRRLRIQRPVPVPVAVQIVQITAGMPDGPTISIQRGENANESVVFFSKRTYDWLQQKLRNMKLEGMI